MASNIIYFPRPHANDNHVDGPPAGALALRMTRKRRAAVESAVTSLLALLDYIDGDADLEDGDQDHGADEGEPFFHDPVARRQNRSRYAGPGCPISDSDYGGEEPGEREDAILTAIYGINQTLGPINEREAVQEHLRREQEADWAEDARRRAANRRAA